jgi:putative heme iron utilization protein
MDRETLTALRDLLSSNRLLALAVIVEDQPEAALLPYALREDFGAAFVQASGLARHARGLTPGAQVGLLIHASDSSEVDAMQVPRLMVSATVRILERGSDEFRSAAARFVARFPDAEMTLELADFNLYELTFGRGRYVEGFARAVNVGQETFKEMGS